MASKILLFLLILAFSPGHSGGARVPRNTSVISVPPKNQPTSFVDFLSNAINLLTNVPISLVRSVGRGGGINGVPVSFNDNNFASLGDNIFSEFNFGLRNEDCDLSCSQLITKYGHQVETHEVVTEDGYILKMFRIPSDGPPVLLQHGLIGSGDDFIVAGPKSGIAYLLANDGYDVWLANSRGNKHSRRHIEKKPTQGSFWDFSWHEIGYYDVPATIDYVLNVTSQDQLKYIGHSQGTTAFFVMGAERPEYMDKIALAVAMSPVTFNSHMKSPFIRLLAPSNGLLYAASKYLGIHELVPDNNFMKLVRWLTCGRERVAELVCSNFMFVVAGFNVDQLNVTNLPVIFSHMPAGASAKQFVHYAQEIISGKFRQFDYGTAENKKRYGTNEPPDYDLKKVTAPVALIYSDTDWLASSRDVAKLEKILPNVVESQKIPDKNFNHLDFVIAKNVKQIIYKRLSKMLSRF